MRRLLNMDEAAEELGICTSTLREHVRHGEIPFISMGRGEIRKRRLFDPADLEAFVDRRRERETCQSIRTSAAPTINMTSNVPVYDFMARRAAQRAEKLKNSKPSARKRQSAR
ncbi:helix-turn-helix domain-containing protein [Xanthobacter sp. KR7-65]|uniref:helix-turn-helix domain-containing protein n=1 Tax=Xanthobacter sp. KR7-65 TaxID=3156612 RepID=UPI0032B33871